MASSKSKAFLAERGLRTFRQKLTLLRAKMGPKNYQQKGWAPLASQIVNGYNASPHSSLLNQTPHKVMTFDGNAMKVLQANIPSRSFEEWKKSKLKHTKEGEKYNGQYVRILTDPATVFTKKSMRAKVGLEIFKVSNIRVPIGDDKKKILLTLTDLLNEKVLGVFRVTEVILIDPESTFHPNHPNFKRTVKEVMGYTRDGRGYKYHCKFLGK
jgi:hypothetical protein